ncbi:hypothetical protein [Kineosporia sp. NBRC 101731]|uniref:hypothetical protein n=1 Tax=Kineosporia sp. NBRC 101731 TaxID=3032199 RepID=UPI0024A56FFB|nr:hypothetical protein [Kineosporia sp. NBRC 101731]GLY31484.1 hypothetical protein Kisp02_48490 [Kineosporia sp. NBRC 101731]
MTVTDTSTASGFQNAARVYRMHQEIARSLDASKSNAVYAVDTDLLRECLTFLVGFGYLSTEQADALWSLLTGRDGFVDLPALPFVDGRAGSAVYDALRGVAVAATARAEDADSSVDSVVDTIVEIGEAIVTIVHVVQEAGGALSDLWTSIFG